MSKYARILIGLVLLSTACTKNEKETPNGFKYQVLKAGDGAVAKAQDIIVFEYVLKDSKDSVWADTYKQGLPAAVPVPDSAMMATEKGMMQMFRYLSKGDSVRATMPMKRFIDDIAGGMPPFKIDTTLSISYTIKVSEILTRDQFQEYQTTLMQKLTTKQVAKDAELINKYLTDNKIEAQTDSSGIRYVVHKSTGGAKPTVQNCVEVSYKGTFMEDGEVFDQSPSMSFSLMQVIPGWQKAIPLLSKGDSATFYIPSGLAYGPQGQPGGIPPNAILIFNVALKNFAATFDPGTGKCK